MIEKVAISGVPLLSRSRSAGSVIVPSFKARTPPQRAGFGALLPLAVVALAPEALLDHYRDLPALADRLRGGNGDDTMVGTSAGGDTLFGDADNDLLIGASGNDVYNAGSGNDVIDARNGGIDTLTCHLLGSTVSLENSLGFVENRARCKRCGRLR